MSKPFTNPFFEADISKFFDVSKLGSEFRVPQLPQFDVEAAVSLQRKNFEAYTSLSQAIFESFQSLWRRQADVYRQIVEEATQTAGAIASLPSPEEKAVKQAEVSKLAIEKSFANIRDISETISKCNAQALETVSGRVSESIDELRSIIKSGRAA